MSPSSLLRGLFSHPSRPATAACRSRNWRGRTLRVEPLEQRAMLAVTADANSNVVSNLYADVLGRLAAASEVDYWHGQLAAGQSQDSVVVGFVLSTEHRRNVVEGIYEEYLGRGAEPSGRDYWVNVLGQGVSEFRLLALIVGSDEYYRNHGGDDAGFVRGLYHDVLQRPDPPGPSEIGYWHGVLSSGKSRATVAEGFITSPEFIGVGVDQMYRDFLRRDADPGGRAYWLNQFLNGATTFQIQRFLLDSPEYNSVAQRSVEPGAQLVLLGQPIDPTADIKIEFADSQGFKVDVPPVAVASNQVTAIVPALIDPATGQPASGTVHVQVLQNSAPVRPATIGALQIQNLPSSPFAPGTVTLAYVQGLVQAIQQLQTELTTSSLSAHSVGVLSASQFNTPALSADLAADLGLNQLLAGEIQDVKEHGGSFSLGTYGGHDVIFSQTELMMLDKMMLSALDGVKSSPSPSGVDSGQQLAAAARANPTANLMADLILADLHAPGPPDDTLDIVAKGMFSFSLGLMGGAFVGSIAMPAAAPLGLVLYGSGLIMQSVSVMINPEADNILGDIRGSIDSLQHYAADMLSTFTAQSSGLLKNALSSHATAFEDVQKAGPAGEIFVSGGLDVTIHEVIGDEAAFDVYLTKKPQGVVTVNLTNGDPSRGILSPSILVFNPDNWWLPQRVRITAVNTQTADGNHNFAITLAPAQSTMPDYQGVRPFPSQILVTDVNDNRAGVIVSPTSGLVTTEDGGSAQFTIQLASKPVAPVKMVLVSSDTSEGDVTPGKVTFDATNWNVPRVFTVYGKNDGVREGLVPYTIIVGGASSTDPAYSGLDAPDVSVVNVDNGQATPTPDTTGVWQGQFTESNPLGTISGGMTVQLHAFPKYTTVVTGSVTTSGSGTLDLIGTVAGSSFVFNIDLQPGFIVEQLTGTISGGVMTGSIYLEDYYGGVTTGKFTLTKVA